jgi:hypothetical protein
MLILNLALYMIIAIDWGGFVECVPVFLKFSVKAMAEVVALTAYKGFAVDFENPIIGSFGRILLLGAMPSTTPLATCSNLESCGSTEHLCVILNWKHRVGLVLQVC